MFKRFITIGLSVLLLAGAFCGIATVKTGATDIPATEDDPMVLANTVLEEVGEKEHPYMLYSIEEIDALRDKTNRGNSKKAYEIIETTAKSIVRSTVPVNSGSGGVVGRKLQYFVAYLSFYSMLSGDDTYADKAVDIVVSAAKSGSVEMYLGINDALCVGDFGHAYALAYDLLYDRMNEEERALIKSELEEIGEWIYVNSTEIDTWGADTANRKAWNWNAVTHGALGLISIALGDHQEWLEMAILRTQGYYEFAVDSTGAGMEGLHYIGYALNFLTPLDFAIYRASGVELMDAYSGIQAMPYWSMLYMTTPQGKEQVAINQGDGVGNYSGPFYIINRYGQSDALWGWEHTYGLEGDGKFTTEYQGNGWSAPAIILFEDQSLTPEKPTAEGTPLLATFEKGLVSVRDSWENDATMMTFTCGYGQSGCWNHPDDNSFTFYAGGESFIIDSGANRKESSDHNVVIIDGVGMDYSGGATMREGYIEENKLLANGNLYLRGNNINSYSKQKLKSSIRQIVFGDGEVPFVLVYDHVRKDSSSHTFNINFYTKLNNEIAIAEDGSYATITGNNQGKVCYVIPYAPEGAALKTSGNAVTTEVQASMLRQATLFIMAEPDGSMPQVEFSTEGREITVSITRTLGGEEITETYVFGVDQLVGFETTEEIEVETETESIPETETESKPADTETEAGEDTSEDNGNVTTDETESKSQATENNGNQSSGGCGSTIGVAIIPVVVSGAVAVMTKKKKK